MTRRGWAARDGRVRSRSTRVRAGLSVPIATVGAMRAEGTLTVVARSFDVARSAATTSGRGGGAQFVVIDLARGTGELAGIGGTGGLAMDQDGAHRFWLEYELR